MDRHDLYSAIGGGLTGAKGYSAATAAGVAILLEAVEAYRAGTLGNQEEAPRHIGRIAIAMGAWWLSREVFHRGARVNPLTPGHGQEIGAGEAGDIARSFRELPVRTYGGESKRRRHR